MKAKLLISMQGGVIHWMASNQDIDVVIVDFDRVDEGEPPVGDVIVVDYSKDDGQFYELYSDAEDPREMEAREQLKAMKF